MENSMPEEGTRNNMENSMQEEGTRNKDFDSLCRHW